MATGFPAFLLPSLDWLPYFLRTRDKFPGPPAAPAAPPSSIRGATDPPSPFPSSSSSPTAESPTRTRTGAPSSSSSPIPSSSPAPSPSPCPIPSPPHTTYDFRIDSGRGASPDDDSDSGSNDDDDGDDDAAAAPHDSDRNIISRRHAHGRPRSAARPNPPPRPRRLSRIGPDLLKCQGCSSDLAFSSQIISKGFTGRHGRAYLVSPTTGAPTDAPAPSGSLMNIVLGRVERRELVTGQHTVADIGCAVCGSTLGWKYVDAREESQRYKIGKFILETEMIIKYPVWGDVGGGGASGRHGEEEEEEDDDDDDDDGDGDGDDHDYDYESGAGGGERDWERERRMREGEQRLLREADVEFDSDNSEECEELFHAVWDATKVAARRRYDEKCARMEAMGRARSAR